MLLNPYRFGPLIDTDAQGWATAVTANGGTYSAGTLLALSDFITAAKANGYWASFNLFNPVAGDQLLAAAIQWIDGTWAPAPTLTGLVSGDYTEATGITAVANSKYIRTGFIPSAHLVYDSTHIAIYNRATANAGGNVGIGCLSGSNNLRMYSPYADGVVYSSHYSSSLLTSSVLSRSTGFGLIVSSRIASNDHKVYQKGVQVATTSNVNVLSLPTIELYVCANNNGGAVSDGVTHPVAGYSAGAGLSGAVAALYHTDFQAFQTALGRAV